MRKRGSILIVSLVIMALFSLLATAFFMFSNNFSEHVRYSQDKLKAYYASEAGIQQALKELGDIFSHSSFSSKAVTVADYIDGLDNPGSPFFDGDDDNTSTMFSKETLDGNTNFTVTLSYNYNFPDDDALKPYLNDPRKLASAMGLDDMNITITSHGFCNDREKIIQAVIRLYTKSGSVFDYPYFINNWGWFYGDAITSKGNVKSNGNFSFAQYSPIIGYIKRYSSLAYLEGIWKLLGFIDNGGIYSGHLIQGANNVRALAPLPTPVPKYPNEPIDPMPNLYKTEFYETLAKKLGTGSIKGKDASGNDVILSDEIYGDEDTEPQGSQQKGNLALVGKDRGHPITINGLVVVKGNLIITGYIRGKGLIYCEGNIYIPNDLVYWDPPNPYVPVNDNKETVEAWINNNKDKDLVGLFAKEHIVMANFNDNDWLNNVRSWLNNPLNESNEKKLGLDGIPNTGDVGENDNTWDVERYTAKDEELGLGNEGDPIPGTGEDVDGDGKYDNRINTNEFQFNPNFNSANWGGNYFDVYPHGNYSTVATFKLNEIDAALYTNHAIAGLVGATNAQDLFDYDEDTNRSEWKPNIYNAPQQDPWTGAPMGIRFYGNVCSRVESIIYWYNCNFTYDRRLFGGSKVLIPDTNVNIDVDGDGNTDFQIPAYEALDSIFPSTSAMSIVSWSEIK